MHCHATDQEISDAGGWADCWIYRDVFRRRRETNRYSKNAVGDGANVSMATLRTILGSVSSAVK